VGREPLGSAEEDAVASVVDDGHDHGWVGPREAEVGDAFAGGTFGAVFFLCRERDRSGGKSA